MAGRTSIGLDIGTSAVRAAQLRISGSGITLERFGEVPLPPGAVRAGEVLDPARVAGALRELWAAVEPAGDKVVLGVASPAVVVEPAELPISADRQLALPASVTDRLPMPLESTLVDFLALEPAPSPGAPQVVRGLLVAVPRALVEAAVAAVELADLLPSVVDLTGFAALRAVGRVDEFGLGVPVEAVIDIGAELTGVVVHAGGTPRFVHVLQRGGRDVATAIAGRAGLVLDEAETLLWGLEETSSRDPLLSRVVEATVGALVRDLRACLEKDMASSGGPAVGRVTLTGGAAELVFLRNRLQAAVGVPVDRVSPLDAVRLGRTGLTIDQLEEVASRAAVAIGLALVAQG